MTMKDDWLICNDPGKMIPYLRLSGMDANWIDHPGTKWLHRKFKLFACACHEPDENWRLWANEEQIGVSGSYTQFEGASVAVGIKVGQSHGMTLRKEEQKRRADMIRDMFGNPFKPVSLPPGPKCKKCRGRRKVPPGAGGAVDRPYKVCRVCKGNGYGRSPWITDSILTLANAVWESRSDVDGTLDNLGLSALADKLEEEGCINESLLSHLRSPGQHFRGGCGVWIFY